MRFFSNEAKDNDERDEDVRTERDDRTEHVQSEPVAVPQQRAGSPWQHGPADGTERPVVDPAPQPTAFGASTVGGAVAASAVAGANTPVATSTSPATDAASGVADDRTVPLGDRDGDGVSESGRSGAADDEVAWPGAQQRGEHRRDADDDVAVDLALEDKGTFDDPQLTQDLRTDNDRDRTAGDDTGRDRDRDRDQDRDDDGVDDRDEAAAHRADTTPDAVVATTPVAVGATETAALSGPAPFFPAAETDALRERWRDVQLRFVDDPKGATAEAAGLVDEAVDRLTSALRDQRGSLAKGTDDTESLRVELRSYRDILDRLLGL